MKYLREILKKKANTTNKTNKKADDYSEGNAPGMADFNTVNEPNLYEKNISPKLTSIQPSDHPHDVVPNFADNASADMNPLGRKGKISKKTAEIA